MTDLGIAITLLDAFLLILGFALRPRTRFPAFGWMGVAVLAAAEGLLFVRLWPVTVYFTPIAWTAYLLIVDAMVRSLTGKSRLTNRPHKFLEVALLSIALWVIFEAYNLRLANWTYVGVPTTPAGALLGYGWSFATITPAIFETADLIETLCAFTPSRPIAFSSGAKIVMVLFGGLCLIIPLLMPRRVASYLFVLVWVGFVFLLDPINCRLGWPSLVGDLRVGYRGRFYSLLLSGWICGWFWEFWNYWAAAKWHYIFPIFQKHKIFEMPAPGYVGFLPFALECFVMYITASSIISQSASRLRRS
jgi:hypothetical protein